MTSSVRLLPSSVPDATEEEWQRRLEKRRRIIDIVKSGTDYADAGTRSVTPDPTTRTSKRHWEHAMKEWRKALRQP